MELKREMFFDGETILTKNIITTVTSHPQEMERILNYVFDEIKQLGEYMGKKTALEKEHDMKVHKLQEEYDIIHINK